MSDIQSIHEFDLNMICEYFSALTRQGPGSPEITNRAFDFIDGINSDSHVADIGCGTGGQTMVLAQRVSGKITGIDLFPRFIDLFNANARQHGLNDRVTGCVGSMDNLPFDPGKIDLIWSEGAIYNIGFERGLREWRQYIKIGGYIAVSEVSWFTDKRPDEIEDFWMEAYPEINTIPVKLAQVQTAGYMPVACFALPESCWLDHFYSPQAEAQKIFLAKHPKDASVKGFIENQRHEQRLYEKYKKFYGYVFYIGKKI
ncbi:Methyltransferase domain protein [Desulfosarcina cetonica]|uniref:class I SAM-dependent methyltransferase n=1 Tax=Desulfosarcina cetonica TaxID=90730 RepID=UPI000B088AAF|nr:class I SAM-dependent methyltransferase [Desulfosarcina cetonica]VTR68587.1 Methyltransferase domain protein [Desulfosarcina cetonica]